MNLVILEGNLAKDIELKYLSSGRAVANSTIAINKKWNDENGDKQSKVTFTDITLYGKQAEIANQYLSKGSHILINGELNQQIWTDSNNQTRSKLYVVVDELKMLDKKATQEQDKEQPKASDENTQIQEQSNSIEKEIMQETNITNEDIQKANKESERLSVDKEQPKASDENTHKQER